jgi:DNA-binding NarL/FixJ family response regulator
VGRVSTDDELRLAVLAAARGAGVIAFDVAPVSLRARLADDLSRLGDVELLSSETPTLSVECRCLLEAIATGASVRDAAASIHLSTRTANRRLAEGRRALGVRSNAEAVMAAIRLGLAAPAGVDPR